MNKNDLKAIVEDQASQKLQEGLVAREMEGRVAKEMKNPFVVIISGVRRCGKSVLMNMTREREDGYYLNFDDERLVQFDVDDFQALHEIFIELYGKKGIFYFDEVQNVKGWELFVRRMRDSGRKVFVTGSNASMLSRELGTHLTGRYIQMTLYPFSFREFLSLRGTSWSKRTLLTTNGRAVLKRLFNEYLVKGGMPEYLRTGNKEHLRTLYENILYRDVLVRYKLTNEKVMKELVHFISSNVSKEISFNSLRGVLGLKSPTTVKEYFSYLENSFLVFLVPKFSASLKKQMYSNKKVYFIDNGLVVNVGFRLSEDRGRLLENMVFLELKRRGKEIFYFRAKGECDFIAGERGAFKAIQVCYDFRKETEGREIGGLLEAMDSLKIKEGLIVTYDQVGERIAGKKKIQILPAWKWLLGLS